jgi:hypothetical protein
VFGGLRAIFTPYAACLYIHAGNHPSRKSGTSLVSPIASLGAWALKKSQVLKPA